MMAGGRTLWIGLDLLDRQLIDPDGRPVAKIDDIEISSPTADEERPTVTALLCGPAALGRRFGPRTGGFFTALRGVLRGNPAEEPVRIGMDLVTDIGPAVKLGEPRDALPVNAIEDFLSEHLIGHIPGAGIPGPDDAPARDS